jgi:hypothetical protein
MNMDLHLRLDEHDLERARLRSGIGDLAALVQHVLREYVHLKASLDLIRLRGSAPDVKGPPRRRPPDSENRPIEPDLEDRRNRIRRRLGRLRCSRTRDCATSEAAARMGRRGGRSCGKRWRGEMMSRCCHGFRATRKPMFSLL